MFFNRFKKSNENKENKFDNKSKIKYIIAGLGNPGEKYTYTRHNAGFLALDYISQKYNFKINNIKFKSYCAKYSVSNKLTNSYNSYNSINSDDFENNGNSENVENFDVLFMKPQTFMNKSGEAVSEAARFYKIKPENILVIFDDIMLPTGKLRIRKSGSDGGHNGLKSIILNLSSDEFPRIKIGVGEKPRPDYELADWVTSKFSKEDEKIMFEMFAKVYECVDMFLQELPIEKIQNKYN